MIYLFYIYKLTTLPPLSPVAKNSPVGPNSTALSTSADAKMKMKMKMVSEKTLFEFLCMYRKNNQIQNKKKGGKYI